MMFKRVKILKMSDADLDKKVLIQGTRFDRKRKISARQIRKMNRLYKKYNSYYKVAKDLGYSYLSVRYNLDKNYKELFNAKRDGKHTGVDVITPENRAKYKRHLVKTFKPVIILD